MTDRRPLRDYQAHAIELLGQALTEGRNRPVLMAATGAGKTRIATEIIDRAMAKGNRVAFCVPALSLIDQSVRAFWQDGVWEVGVMQADHHMTDPARPAQICSIQTLERRGYPVADLVIIDECHRSSKFVERWMKDPAWLDVPFIGLSATPWARGMAKHYNDLIIVATTADLIKQGLLSPFRVFAPSHPDLSNVKVVAGDYHEGQLSEVMNADGLVADVVETWLKVGGGRPTLCYAVDCAHAKHLQERFIAAGVKAGYQDAFTPEPERETIRRRFHTGEIEVVCNVGTLTTGVDWDVRCIILARPTRSEMLFVQIIGRGLRTADGKKDCLILDHSDNHSRLGFVTEIHHAQLDDGARKKKAEAKPPLPKECPKCKYLRPPKVSLCPNCGHQPTAPIWQKVNDDGELQELDPSHSGIVKHVSGQTGVALHGKPMTGADFYSQLKWYGMENRYKPGWAAYKFKEMFGYWPSTIWRALSPMETSPQVRSWIKSRQIAHAHRRSVEKKAAQA